MDLTHCDALQLVTTGLRASVMRATRRARCTSSFSHTTRSSCSTTMSYEGYDEPDRRPFPPRLDATVGGLRVVAEFVATLSTRHDLVRVGSHTRTHPRLTELGREELVAEAASASYGAAYTTSPDATAPARTPFA